MDPPLCQLRRSPKLPGGKEDREGGNSSDVTGELSWRRRRSNAPECGLLSPEEMSMPGRNDISACCLPTSVVPPWESEDDGDSSCR